MYTLYLYHFIYHCSIIHPYSYVTCQYKLVNVYSACHLLPVWQLLTSSFKSHPTISLGTQVCCRLSAVTLCEVWPVYADSHQFSQSFFPKRVPRLGVVLRTEASFTWSRVEGWYWDKPRRAEQSLERYCCRQWWLLRGRCSLWQHRFFACTAWMARRLFLLFHHSIQWLAGWRSAVTHFPAHLCHKWWHSYYYVDYVNVVHVLAEDTHAVYK